jgi:hypothetical protein
MIAQHLQLLSSPTIQLELDIAPNEAMSVCQFIVNRNAQANGEHEVHNLTTGCIFMPDPKNRIDLGEHPNW